MIKAVARTQNGREVLMIGLSFGNLDKFKAEPGDSYIEIKGADVGLPVDVLIFSGETEQAMARSVASLIGPETKVRVGRTNDV